MHIIPTSLPPQYFPVYSHSFLHNAAQEALEEIEEAVVHHSSCAAAAPAPMARSHSSPHTAHTFALQEDLEQMRKRLRIIPAPLPPLHLRPKLRALPPHYTHSQ